MASRSPTTIPTSTVPSRTGSDAITYLLATAGRAPRPPQSVAPRPAAGHTARASAELGGRPAHLEAVPVEVVGVEELVVGSPPDLVDLRTGRRQPGAERLERPVDHDHHVAVAVVVRPVAHR